MDLNFKNFDFETMDKNVDVPLLALSVECQTILSTLLNPIKIIPTETNLPRDWRGVAELGNVPSEKISLFESKADPFKEILCFLSGSKSMKIHVDDLKAYLGVIDRFDVIDDAKSCLDRDVIAYKQKVNEVRLDHIVTTLDVKDDSNILTFEDSIRAQKNLPLCRYDAFILYSDDDESFATEIIDRMENKYNLKLCTKDRDLLPGLKFEHDVIGKMIEERCNRLLVIFSPSFLQSSANQYLVSYAQALALDTHCRKIIPCVYKKCELPPSVKYSFCIDYNRSGKLWNFWDKLSQSLMTAPSGNSQPLSGPKLTSLSGNTGPTDPLDSWDAEKPPKSSIGSSESDQNALAGSNTFKKHLSEDADTLSIHSQARLLPTSDGSTKSSKWFSKIMSPINKKKRSEKDKVKQKAAAD